MTMLIGFADSNSPKGLHGSPGTPLTFTRLRFFDSDPLYSGLILCLLQHWLRRMQLFTPASIPHNAIRTIG
jgi:hypothetical protein